jgi:AhpD family alkylhydroperoxidase
MSNVKEFYANFAKGMAKVQKEMPNAVGGFMGLFQQTMGDGALSVKEKELIALSIGLAVRCEPCILMHIKKAIDAGATREQVIETAQVVVMMQGGPGYVHLPMVLEALEAIGA